MALLENKTLLNLFSQSGVLIEVEGNQPIILHDQQMLYYVKTGHIELFSASYKQEEVIDKRSYLFRAETDQIIYGIHHNNLENSLGLVLTGSSGTQLLKMSKLDFLAQLKNQEIISATEYSINEWISLWSLALRKENFPSQFTLLEVGEALKVEADTVVRTSSKVQWIKMETNDLHWMGREFKSSTYQYFPLSAGSWFKTGHDTQLSSITTADWLTLDNKWLGIQYFHELVYECLQQNLIKANELELERLHNKRENERKFMNQAVDQIASVTQSVKKKVIPIELADDPLYLACLTVGESLGIEIQPLTTSAITSRDPVNDIAKASRISTRQVVLKGEWWKDDNGSMLAFMEEDGRPVALIQKNPQTYELHDPQSKAVIIVTAEVANKLKAFAHTFYRPLPSHKLSLLDIIKFGAHKSLKRDFIMIIIMGVIGGLLGMTVPIATGILFDSIIPEAERGQLIQMTMILFVVAVSILLFEMTRSMAMLRIEGRMDSSIQAAVWDRLLNLPVPFFRDFSAGDLAMRANSINTIRQAISGIAITTIFSSVFSSFNFLLLFYYNVKLAMIAFVLVVISITVTSVFSIIQVRYQRKLVAIQGKISGLVLQILNGVAKFRVTGAENRAFFLWANLFSDQKRTAFTSRSIANWLGVFNSIFPILTSMVLFYFVITSGSTGLSAGKFLAFFAAFSAFLGAMLAMSSALISIINIIPLYERAKPILEATPEVNEAMADSGELSGAIEVSHLNFKYTQDQPMVLQDISLQIKPGEFVALIGSSGCGKSTLFRLLLGFEKPNSGSIYYDGQDLKQVDVRSVRSQLGVVLQNSRVMTGDIFTNIVGSSNLTIDDAWDAARLAGFEEDIKEMPMGMHTVISEGGGTLSGGQRQRMLIARAIARKPRIIYFDEATSALDNRTQAIVSNSLEKLQATRVVIAHRLSTIMNADRIFVLDKGRIIQSGTYHELLHQDGLFAELAKRQLA